MVLGHIECTLFKSLDFVNLWSLGHMLQSSWGSLGEVHTVNGVGTQETHCSQHEEPILICLGKTGTMKTCGFQGIYCSEHVFLPLRDGLFYSSDSNEHLVNTR